MEYQGDVPESKLESRDVLIIKAEFIDDKENDYGYSAEMITIKKEETIEEVQFYVIGSPNEIIKDEKDDEINAEIMTIKVEKESDPESQTIPISEINLSMYPMDNASIVNSGGNIFRHIFKVEEEEYSADVISPTADKLDNRSKIEETQNTHKIGVQDDAINENETTTKRDKSFTKKVFPLECSICKKTCSNASNLKVHMLVHTSEKPHECSVCKKKFFRNCHLTAHMLKHSGEKTHRCLVCSKHFLYKADLNKHQIVHTGEKPYQCRLCNRMFGQKGSLNKHMVVHSAEKPFECDICKSKFARKADLKKHKSFHTNEKPNECSICKSAFVQKGDLKKHIVCLLLKRSIIFWAFRDNRV